MSAYLARPPFAILLLPHYVRTRMHIDDDRLVFQPDAISGSARYPVSIEWR